MTAAFWIGLLVGAAVGAAVALLTRLVLVRRSQSSAEALLGEAARAARMKLDLMVHRAIAGQQVRQFADSLAGDDVQLRERLRRFELGGGQ